MNDFKRLAAVCTALVIVLMCPLQAFADRHTIEVENIMQMPDLPTGCESVSLTIVLNHLGYPADKFDLVRNYLPKQPFYYVGDQLYGADFVTTFAGDPEDEDSYGCYAPCMVTTANNYLRDKGYKGRAYDKTGTDFGTLLCDYIDNDIPIMIWITNYELEPSNLSTIWITPEGKTVQWRRPEHCVVLTGYDREKKLVYVSDPIYGNRTYDYDTLVQRFTEMGKQSVFIDASPDAETHDDTDSDEPHDDTDSEEPHDDTDSDEPHDDTDSDEPYDDTDSDEPHDDTDSDEPYDNTETSDTPDSPDTPDNALGDIDGDGSVTSRDALAVLRFSVGLEQFDKKQFFLADMNHDGSVTSDDALAVLRVSVGIGTTA